MARKFAIMALVALSAVLALLPGGPAAASEPVQLSALAQPVHVLGTALTLKAGDLDPTFDGDGKVITDFGGTEYLGGVAMQADGKIVAAGQTYAPRDVPRLLRPRALRRQRKPGLRLRKRRQGEDRLWAFALGGLGSRHPI